MTNKKPDQRTYTSSKKANHRNSNVVCDHARLDPSHCLVDSLFKPLLRGRTNAELDVHYRHKDYTFEWKGPELLGINEQSVFLAIHRLAATAGADIRTDCHDTDPNRREARNRLNLAYRAVQSDCLVIKTSANEITRTLGKQVNGQSAKRIIESLMKMSAVQFSIHSMASTSSPVFQTQLISLVESGRTLFIGINPCLGKAICKEPSTYVDMREQRALKSDIAKRLHFWLSAWANPHGYGRDQRISMDKLICHIWGDNAIGDALYARRKKLLGAVSELNSLIAWTCVLNTNDILHVQRAPVGVAGAIVRDVTNVNC